MVDKRKLKNDIVLAFVSQGVSLIISIITSLIIPKVLGVESFGYWQLFLFYTSYVGFFHLGLNDGVYLLNGGIERDTIDKQSIKSQFVFGFLYQALIAFLIVVVASLISTNSERRFVLTFTALFLLLNNLSLYFGFVFQAMNETKLYSYSVIVDKGVYIIPLVILLLSGNIDFRLYIIWYAVSKTCSLIYVLWQARDFFKEKLLPFRLQIRDSINSISVGYKLMIANIASYLIIGSMRFLIDSRWGIEVFSKVSFSISLVNFVILFVQQLSMVLFPALRQLEKNTLRKIYIRIIDILRLITPYIYFLYFPAYLLVNAWLPDYRESIYYFIFLLPICVYDGEMEIACTTFFKVLRKERTLLNINIISVLLSFVLVFFSAYILNSVELSLISVVCVIIFRNILSNICICKDMQLSLPKNTFVMSMLTTVLFCLLLVLTNILMAFNFYLIILCLYTLSFRKQLLSILGK